MRDFETGWWRHLAGENGKTEREGQIASAPFWSKVNILGED